VIGRQTFRRIWKSFPRFVIIVTFINIHEMSLLAGRRPCLQGLSACTSVCLSICLFASRSQLIRSIRASTSNRIEQKLCSAVQCGPHQVRRTTRADPGPPWPERSCHQPRPSPVAPVLARDELKRYPKRAVSYTVSFQNNQSADARGA